MSTRLEHILGGVRNNTLGVAPTARGGAVHNVEKIPVDAIDPDPENARQSFDPDELAALAEDLKIHGQAQNAVVWQLATPGRYQLVAGERRWRACKLAGIPTLVCMVLPRDMPKEQREDIAFAENLARSELKPVEVARHWKRLMDRRGCTVRELAARVGVAPSTISKRLALLKLDAATQRAVDAGEVQRTAAVESVSKPRRGSRAARPPRGVYEFKNGVVKVKRGSKLEKLLEEITWEMRVIPRPPEDDAPPAATDAA